MQQRSASALAVSLVAFVGCDGNLEGAARAMVAAAASGDHDAFTAGLSVGAATLTGADSAHGKMAEVLSETFTTADADKQSKAVAAAMGSAIGAMAEGPQAALIQDAISALNDVADGGQCALAATTAFELYRSLKSSNKLVGAKFLAHCISKGKLCWSRRVVKLAASAVFSRPPPVSPCSSYIRNASAVSVSLVSASACGIPSDKQLDAAAYALVTAATKDGCSFASAVASASLAGLSNSSQIVSVYQAAIPKAKLSGKSAELANSFASALYEVVGVQGDASGLMGDIISAISRTIKVSGCSAAGEFTTGVVKRLASQDSRNADSLKKGFMANPIIAKCKYALK